MVKSWLFEYQFLDQEANVSLIKWAVTLELKSVQYWCWFYTAPDATKSSVITPSANTISIFCSGCFLDLPVGKKKTKWL
jgi:hypothetical protein